MIEPLGNHVVIRPHKRAQKSKGGVVLPESFEEDSGPVVVGTVIAIGPGTRRKDGTREPLTVYVGATVIWRNSFGAPSVGAELCDELERGDAIVPEDDILAIIR